MDRLETVLTSFISEVHQDIAEMRQWRMQSQKQWGEIAQKTGSFVEDIVAPNIPRLGQEVHFYLLRRSQKQFSIKSQLKLSPPCQTGSGGLNTNGNHN